MIMNSLCPLSWQPANNTKHVLALCIKRPCNSLSSLCPDRPSTEMCQNMGEKCLSLAMNKVMLKVSLWYPSNKQKENCRRALGSWQKDANKSFHCPKITHIWHHKKIKYITCTYTHRLIIFVKNPFWSFRKN